MEVFFNNEKMKESISTYLKILGRKTEGSVFEKNRDSYASFILRNMVTESEYWDKRTQFNIRNIGEQFQAKVKEADMSKESIDDLYCMLLRFFVEEYINNPRDSSGDYQSVRDFSRMNINEFSGVAPTQIYYALNEMSTSILKSLINSDDLVVLKKFTAFVDVAKNLHDEWKKDLSESELKVQALHDTLTQQQNAFNFVNLNQGFESLAKNKRSELFWARLFMIALGMALPLVIGYESLRFFESHSNIKNIYEFLSLIPAASLTIILLYYFRISLKNFNSIRSQIMQIDLRKTLCQFIQGYAEYSSDIKAKDKNLLDKFEDVIFTNIMPSEEKIPSTFDGIEQVVNLINSIKNK